MGIWLYKLTLRKPGGTPDSVAMYYVEAATEGEARRALEAEHLTDRASIESKAELTSSQAREVRDAGGWIRRVREA